MSQAWKWGIGVGVLIAFVGLTFIPAALRAQNSAENVLGAGLAIFSIGILTVAISFYVRSKSLLLQPGVDTSSSIPSGGKQRKPICDACHKAAAVIQCTMHKTVLCPACLSGHYESRGCVYVPNVRRSSIKTARGAVASRG